jgi:hypothetical protein
MLIALDYDQTYTTDPELWDDFVKNCIEKGHEVICVTMRFDNDVEGTPVLESIGKHCRVIFTGRLAKLSFVKDMGIFPDIWIDDRPYYIYEDSWSFKNE